MSPEDQAPLDPPESTSPASDVPAIEDAYAPSETEEETVGEDDPQLLDPKSRALQSDEASSDADEPGADHVESQSALHTQRDDTSDVDTSAVVTDPPASATVSSAIPNWDTELSAHKIMIELRHVEEEVRSVLDVRDTKRRRKLAGTRRWLELEEDILSWRHAGRIDEDTLSHLHQLVARRHYLFQRLHFIAGTRPGWNS